MNRKPAGIAALVSRLPADWLILLLILLIQLVLSSPRLMPAYQSINAFDEAKYIESGRLLLQGELRTLSWGPIVALVYAPFALLWGNSPDWFVLSARSGQMLMFTAMWLSTVYLGRQVGKRNLGLVTAGVLFVSTSFYGVLNNQSDAIFVCFSALALAKLTSFGRGGTRTDVRLGSLFIGLACLARVEAVLYMPLYLALVLWLGSEQNSWRSGVIDSVVPCTLLLVLFIVVASTSGVSSPLGVAGKSYDSFEVNQPIPGGGTNAEQRLRAIELFGTQEENQSSVPRAITRNPGAFVERIGLNALIVPSYFFDNFGARLGAVFLLLAAIGVWSQTQSPARRIGVAMLLWTVPPAISLVFLPLHYIRQISFVILIFAAIGVQTITRRDSRATVSAGLALAVLIGVFGCLSGRLGLMAGCAVFLSSLLIWRLLQRQSCAHAPQIAGLLLMLGGGLILRPSFRFPDYSPIGETARERAVHYLDSELPTGARILEPLPLPAVAAQLDPVSTTEIPASIDTVDRFAAWLHEEQIAAVYVEDNSEFPLDMLDWLAQHEGEFWTEVYTSDDGQIHIYALE